MRYNSLELEESARKYSIRIVKKNDQNDDNISRFLIDEEFQRLIVLSWKGILNVKYLDRKKEDVVKFIAHRSDKEMREKNKIGYEEYYEGLSYNPEERIIVVSSVKLKVKSDKYFQNSVYLYKLTEQAILMQSKYQRSYAPSQCIPM